MEAVEAAQRSHSWLSVRLTGQLASPNLFKLFARLSNLFIETEFTTFFESIQSKKHIGMGGYQG